MLTLLVAFDHSANFCEIHLNAMYTGSNQVHVGTAHLVTQPGHFFEILDIHRVGYTFLPNFFLAAATKAFLAKKNPPELDLCDLSVIMCGGEANRVATFENAEQLLIALGAPRHTIKAAYGLSEVSQPYIEKGDHSLIARRLVQLASTTT